MSGTEEEADVQDVDLVRQDAVLEAVLEDHDVVVGDGTADERGHGGRGRGFLTRDYSIRTPAASPYMAMLKGLGDRVVVGGAVRIP